MFCYYYFIFYLFYAEKGSIDDRDNFVSPPATKREIKATYLMKSPFLNKFGSSEDVEKHKKVRTIVKSLCPLSKHIADPSNFNKQSEFDLWLGHGLKKRNKYVM